MDDLRQEKIQTMVFAATEMGIAVVQEIAEASLRQKPSMTVKEFTKVLDQYLTTQKLQAKANTTG